MKFRKKPVVINAVQFTDTLYDANGDHPSFIRGAFMQNALWRDDCAGVPILKIKTLEGVMTAKEGDWIIEGIKGEIYPCKPDIFAQTYEPIE